MTHISQKIIKAIKENHIRPKPRWYFLGAHILMGTAVMIAVIVGSLACGVLIRHFVLTDWMMVRRLSGGPLQSLMIVLPYIWFLLLGIVLYLAKWLFAHTEKGYKFSPASVIGGIILTSFLGGLFMFGVHLDVPFERGFRKHMPFYNDYIKERSRHFVDASKGVLAGEILELYPADHLMVIDFRDDKWNVDIRTAEPFRAPFELEEGLHIGILGEKTGPDSFRADQLLPPPPFFGDMKFERKWMIPAY